MSIALPVPPFLYDPRALSMIRPSARRSPSRSCCRSAWCRSAASSPRGWASSLARARTAGIAAGGAVRRRRHRHRACSRASAIFGIGCEHSRCSSPPPPLMFGDRPGRRRAVAQAGDEADCADRARVGAAVLRLPAELAAVDDARQPADARLDRRHDQRVQPARQHGRSVRRHRHDRRRGAADRSAARRGRHAGVRARRSYLGDPARRDRRVSRLQLPPGVDLHGRQRQPVARLQLRRRDAEHGHARRPADPTCCRSSRRRCSCC